MQYNSIEIIVFSNKPLQKRMRDAGNSLQDRMVRARTAPAGRNTPANAAVWARLLFPL